MILQSFFKWKVHTPWCVDCEAISKNVEKLAKHFSGLDNLKFARIDASVNEHPKLKVSQSLHYHPGKGMELSIIDTFSIMFMHHKLPTCSAIFYLVMYSVILRYSLINAYQWHFTHVRACLDVTHIQSQFLCVGVNWGGNKIFTQIHSNPYGLRWIRVHPNKV